MYYGCQSFFRNLKSLRELSSLNPHFDAAYWLYLRFYASNLRSPQGLWGYLLINDRSYGHLKGDSEGTKISNDEVLTQAIAFELLNHL